MKKKYVLLFFVSCSLSISSFCQIFITNVTIVDVEKQKLIPDQTVEIKGDLISNIQPSKNTKIPSGSVVIEGKGKFLSPGLTDSHVHFFQSGGLYTRPDIMDQRKNMPYEKEIAWVHNNMEDLLRRYIQAGITTVIDVGATFNFLQQRDTFVNKAYAPTIYMTGPLLSTREPPVYEHLKNDEPFDLISNTENAKAAVQKQLPYHPDFIKIWYLVKRDSLEANVKRFSPIIKTAVDEAHRNGLKVAVHATQRITAQDAVENGCDYLVHDIEDEVVKDDFIKLLKSKKVVLCPTLTLSSGYIKTFSQKMQFSYYDLTKSNPEQLGSLMDLKHLQDTALINKMKARYNSLQTNGYFNHVDSIRNINLIKMVEAGVMIAAGTDAGNIGTLHATSFISELNAMQKSGMTNWQIIQAATITPAKLLDKENNRGSITVGKKADMILLNANPVDSLENLTKIDKVFNKGYVINPDTLVKETPTALVQRQLNAYNTRNIDAFMEPYAEDVELYSFPDKLQSKGKEAMRKGYGGFFQKTPELHCEIKDRIILGNTIIDKESVTRSENIKVEAVAIYKIENNKIAKVYFISGSPK